MHATLTRNGPKNVVVIVQGDGEGEYTLHPKSLGGCTSIKLDQIIYAIESGVKIRLAWTEDGVLLPLEGRGFLNYDSVESLQASSIGQGLTVQAQGSGVYHIVLDLTKQGQ